MAKARALPAKGSPWPGPELLGSEKVVFSTPIPCAMSEAGWLSSSADWTRNSQPLPRADSAVGSLHWHPAQVALRPGPWNPAL